MKSQSFAIPLCSSLVAILFFFILFFFLLFFSYTFQSRSRIPFAKHGKQNAHVIPHRGRVSWFIKTHREFMPPRINSLSRLDQHFSLNFSFNLFLSRMFAEKPGFQSPYGPAMDNGMVRSIYLFIQLFIKGLYT